MDYHSVTELYRILDGIGTISHDVLSRIFFGSPQELLNPFLRNVRFDNFTDSLVA